MAERVFLSITVAYNGAHTRVGFAQSVGADGRKQRTSYYEVSSLNNDEETIELVAMWIERRLAEARTVGDPRLF